MNAIPATPPKAGKRAIAPPDPGVSVEVSPEERKASRGKLAGWMLPVVRGILGQGAPIKYAAEACRVSVATLEAWIREGLKEGCTDPLKVEFAEVAAQSRHDGNMAHFKRLTEHALFDAKTAHILAKAADPETWVEKKELKVSGTLGHVLADLGELEDLDLPLEDLAAAERVAKARIAAAEKRRLGGPIDD